MKRFSLDHKPENLVVYRKKTTVQLVFVPEPFEVETQEGMMQIGPDTVDDWDEGYYVAYPNDGSKPYSIAPSFVRKNYVEAETSVVLVDWLNKDNNPATDKLSVSNLSWVLGAYGLIITIVLFVVNQ